MYSLLVIEDDVDIAIMVKEYLSKENYDVLIANSGEEGLLILGENNIDLIMLDIMMEGINGYETLERIRTKWDIPVIMTTAKGSQFDKVIGFKKGCDDYMVKPFDLVELNLRVMAILKRLKVKECKDKDSIIYKDLCLNKEEHKILKGNIEVKFTKKEFEILKLLISNQGKIYTTGIIYNLIWNEEYIEGDNSVITHIRNIREKLGDKVKESIYIKTIWGVGYKIEKEN